MGNHENQAKMFPSENIRVFNGLLQCGMGKVPRRQFRPIYLREWIEATQVDRVALARAAGVDRSYIANLIAGRKPNPSAHVLLAFSEFMGITVNDLYRKPPSEAERRAMGDLSPAAWETLSKRRA